MSFGFRRLFHDEIDGFINSLMAADITNKESSMRLGFHHSGLKPVFVILGLAILPAITRLSAVQVDFVHEVVPIIRKHCAECHTGAKKKGGLAMNTRSELLKGGENGRVVEPGRSDKSLMIKLLLSGDDEQWMPPKGDRVPPEQVALLKKWIDSGMEWQPGFSFKSVRDYLKSLSTQDK